MDHDFDDILNEPYSIFHRGKQQGEKQASTYTMEDIQTEGTIFGQQFGEQFAKYEQFLMALQSIDEKKLSNKIVNISKQLKQLMGTLKFQDINQIKFKRNELNKKYNVLLAMLGIKPTQKNVRQEGFDF